MIMALSDIFSNISIIKVKSCSFSKNYALINDAILNIEVDLLRTPKAECPRRSEYLSMAADLKYAIQCGNQFSGKKFTKKQIMKKLEVFEAVLVDEYLYQSQKLNSDIKKLLKEKTEVSE